MAQAEAMAAEAEAAEGLGGGEGGGSGGRSDSGNAQVQSINQSIKTLNEPHASTREATSQHHHTGSKPCVAKRRRLGWLMASRASYSLNMCTLSTEARENFR